MLEPAYGGKMCYLAANGKISSWTLARSSCHFRPPGHLISAASLVVGTLLVATGVVLR
jgi:hypothetical protein